jgi:peptidoglycan/xylan/chitin deacetylase (PgdA/CDA1 family)
MPEQGKELYLTFDDGPVPGPTEFVLETLTKFNVKATFFCIGENVRKHSAVLKKNVAQGHAIGNHTFNHLNGWKTKTGEYYKNVMRCKDEIDKQLQDIEVTSGLTLFRPPYGRITRQQVKTLSLFKIIMWDVLSMDYNKNLLPEKCLRNTIAATRTGSIIVFHDSYKAEKNLQFTLPRFIEHQLEKGFTFKRIDDKISG